MKEILEFSSLILGITIAVHTLYTIGYNIRVSHRSRMAMSEEFGLRFKDDITLIYILSGKANNFRTDFLSKNAEPENSDLPEKEQALQTIITRSANILDAPPEFEFSKWGGSLNKQQLAKLVEFATDLNLYFTRLGLRLEEYQNTPERHGNLERFIACAAMHEDVGDKFEVFQKSLDWRFSRANRKHIKGTGQNTEPVED